MAAAPDIQHGKEFEKSVNEAFKNLYMQYPFRWERTVDSGAAGNLIRRADSDYRMLWKSPQPGQPYLLYVECKASNQGKPFENVFRSLVKGTQNASLQMARRAGAEACVLFHNMAACAIEVWRGVDINEQYFIARKPIPVGPAYKFPEVMLPEFAVWAASHPAEFMAGLHRRGYTDFLFVKE